MPNWCSNNLEVFGEDKDIQEYLGFISPDPNCDEFDFDKIIPIPKALDERPKHGISEDECIGKVIAMMCGYESTYDFCCCEWGTKWNSDCPCVNHTNGSIYFSTAWTPPVPVIQRLSEMFPKLIFRLSSFEGGCGIAQVLDFEKGFNIKSYFPDHGTKEYFELMFEIEGGEDDYVYDPKIDNYVYKEDIE